MHLRAGNSVHGKVDTFFFWDLDCTQTHTHTHTHTHTEIYIYMNEKPV